MGWGRTRARSLARAGARAAGTGDAALPGSAAPPVGAQRVHSVPQSTRWPRAARSTLRLMRRRTECAPRWQGSEPEQRGRRASIEFQQSTIPAAAARWAMLCRAIRTATHWCGSRRGRPLHALACTRRLRTVAKPFTQFQEMHRHARARLQFFNWNRPRTAAATSETQGHALPRAPSLLLSPRHIGRAGGRPRPLWIPAVARALRRARLTGATKMPAQTPSGARVAALQQARSASRPTVPPQ